MITSEDIKRLKSEEELNMQRIKRAEKACKEAQNDKFKSLWYTKFKQLCEKYNKMDYFRSAIN